MTRTFALDPGYAADGGCGVAIFDGPKLVVADLVLPFLGNDIMKRVARTAQHVATWLEEEGGADDFVAEWPQVYVASRSPGDPNDLLGLAGICAAVAAGCDWSAMRSVEPREWKGATKKEAMNARVVKRLSPAERARVRDWGARTHNVLDAVGIGLHHLGRLKRERVIPR